MIFGIGTDMVSIPRISGLIDRYGERFLHKIFTGDEVEEGLKRKDIAHFFAARFAAREAFFKALGTGWGVGLSLKEVGVVRKDKGKPTFILSDRVKNALKQQNIAFCHLSLTHDGDMAQALVILERG
ncbi:MAG: holo-ACP synthase [Candidatus Krumholzibacteria bacterium]|nr:holo-ACP synthase [Candidatus Krumholzibacteria bacterium]